MLFLVFLWHMHQPWYLDPEAGEFALPWVRLHGTKDYLDMAELIREYPSLRAVINVTPCLLEQVELYKQGVRDRHQSLCAKSAEALAPREVTELLEVGFMGLPERMIHPYPRYYELMAKAHRKQPFSVQEIRDLQVWSNLSWMDPRWRRESTLCAALLAKGSRFSEGEKGALLKEQIDLLARIIPSYRSLQESGQVELTTSPWGHPILPLLADSDIAREANPGQPLLSHAFHFPEDVSWHLTAAASAHSRWFGRPPRGLWPSEGSVSEGILPAVLKAGFRWVAADEEILWKSLGPSPDRALSHFHNRLYQPHPIQAGDTSLTFVFRDHLLSDLIGFAYSGWPVHHATSDFLNRLKAIDESFASSEVPPLVLVALDGENPWEAYPEDGEPFLRSLYQALTDTPWIRCSTISEYLEGFPPRAQLKSLAPGSWIRGEFSTWIGNPSQNRGWEELLKARRLIGPERAKSMAVAEGSDWFWWLGPEHSSPQDPVFDRLFREHLKASYRAAGLDPAPQLDEPLKSIFVKVTLPPTGPIAPVLDGEVTSYFEWLQAGELDLTHTGSAMARSKPFFVRFWWGYDANMLYLRLDPAGTLSDKSLTLVIREPRFELTLTLDRGVGRGSVVMTGSSSHGNPQVAVGKILEAALPLEEAGLSPREVLNITMSVEQEGLILEQYPEQGYFTLALAHSEAAGTLWSA